MFTNENKPEFLNAGGNAQRAVWWVNYYAYEFWKIIGIGDEPTGVRVTV